MARIAWAWAFAALTAWPLQGSAQTAPPANAAAVPSLPQRAPTIAAFAPPGWAIEQQHDADLNRDGRRDALLLLRPAGASAESTASAAASSPAESTGGPSPQRLLAVVLGVPGGYALSAVNGRLIPQVDLAVQEDPLADGEIVVRPGGFDLKLTLLAGVGSYETAALRYRFRYQSGCFRLIGHDRLETHRATLDTRDLSINFLTGGVVRTSGNAQSDATKVTRERLAANPRRCLQDLDSAATFQP